MGEDMGEFERPHIDTPAEAVADAMMVAQAEMMSAVTANPDKYLKEGTDASDQMEELVRAASWGMCEAASVYSLYYLAQKYPQQFVGMAILTTYDNYRSPKGRLKDRLNEYHTYFIVRDKKGAWYAASPANHTPNPESSSLTRVIKSTDPQEVVNKIEEVDGGEWPSGDFLSSVFQNGEYKPPSLGIDSQSGKPVLNALRIENIYGHNRAYMDELKLMSTNIQPASQK
jgi:hypothetical protein